MDLNSTLQDPRFKQLPYEEQLKGIKEMVPELSKFGEEEQNVRIAQLIGPPPSKTFTQAVGGYVKDVGKEIASSLTLAHTRAGLRGELPSMLEPKVPGPTEAEAATDPEKNFVYLMNQINRRVEGGVVGGVEDIVNLGLMKSAAKLITPPVVKKAIEGVGEAGAKLLGIQTAKVAATKVVNQALEDTAKRTAGQNMADLLTAKAQDMSRVSAIQNLQTALENAKAAGKQNLIKTMQDQLAKEDLIDKLKTAAPLDKLKLLKQMGVEVTPITPKPHVVLSETGAPEKGLQAVTPSGAQRGATFSQADIEDQAAEAIKTLTKQRVGPTDLSGQIKLQINQALQTNPELFSMVKAGTKTEDFVNAIRSTNPQEAISMLMKDAKEFETKAFTGEEPVPATTTVFEEVNNVKRDFFKALPVESQVAQGMENIAKGQTVVTTPLTSHVGEPTVETSAVTHAVVHPITLYLQKWLLPDLVLGTEAPGKELYNIVRAAELKGSGLSQRYGKIIAAEAALHTPERRLAIGQFMNGQAVPLTDKEMETATRLRNIFNVYADRSKLPKDRRITDYMTHFFDDVSQQPKDMVAQMAGRIGLEDARSGKLGKLGSDVLSTIQGMNKTEGSMSDAFQATLTKINPAAASKYIEQARLAMKGLPNEAFYGPLSMRRVTDLSPENLDFHDVMSRYIAGAERKIMLDRIFAWYGKNSARFSPELRTYAQTYLDALRGTMGAGEAIQTLGLQRAAANADAAGQAWKASLFRGLVPRTLSSNLRKWEFNAKIGGNIASALVNLSQTATNTVTEAGFGSTLNAVRQYTAGGQAVKSFLEANGITYQPAYGGFNETTWGSVARTMSFLFRQTEEFNRGVAFLAGYNNAKKAGMALHAAIKAGQDMVDKTQFVFSKSSIPVGFQGPIASLLFQFRTYTINQIRFIASKYAHMFQTPEDFAKAIRMHVTFGLMGGASSYAIAGLGPMIIASVNETDLPDYVQKTLLYGVPGLADLDLSEQIGLKVTPDIPQDAAGMGRALRTAFGPSISGISDVLMAGMVGELMSVATGQKTQINPDVTKAFFKAVVRNLPFGVGAERVVEATQPYTGRRGRLIAEETPREQAIRALFGARTVGVTQQLAFQQAGDIAQKNLMERKQQLQDELINRMDDISAGRTTVEDIMNKYGASPQDVPWHTMSQQAIAKELPLLARKFAFQWDKNTQEYIKNNAPHLYMQIIGQIERTKGRMENAYPQR